MSWSNGSDKWPIMAFRSEDLLRHSHRIPCCPHVFGQLRKERWRFIFYTQHWRHSVAAKLSKQLNLCKLEWNVLSNGSWLNKKWIHYLHKYVMPHMINQCPYTSEAVPAQALVKPHMRRDECSIGHINIASKSMFHMWHWLYTGLGFFSH